MDLKELDLIGADQEHHWYYASKSHALRRALGDYQPRHILDVGAGSGFFSRVLLRDTSAQSAVASTPATPTIDRSAIATSGSTSVAPFPRRKRTSCC
jgi:hypothetical protein